MKKKQLHALLDIATDVYYSDIEGLTKMKNEALTRVAGERDEALAECTALSDKLTLAAEESATWSAENTQLYNELENTNSSLAYHHEWAWELHGELDTAIDQRNAFMDQLRDTIAELEKVREVGTFWINDSFEVRQRAIGAETERDAALAACASLREENDQLQAIAQKRLEELNRRPAGPAQVWVMREGGPVWEDAPEPTPFEAGLLRPLYTPDALRGAGWTVIIDHDAEKGEPVREMRDQDEEPPAGSIVMDRDGDVFQNRGEGVWQAVGSTLLWEWWELVLLNPLTLVYVPTEN